MNDYTKLLTRTFLQYSLFFPKRRQIIKAETRIFPQEIKEKCWNKSPIVPNRDPSRWRYDAVGNAVMKQLRGCGGIFCHEYDHIYPFSKGGTTALDNCQILQTSVNRIKGNQYYTPEELKTFSQKFPDSLKEINHFSIGKFEMDLMEELIYGNVSQQYLYNFL